MATTILHDDIIFASVSQRGNTIISLKVTGLTSVKEILEYINRTISGCVGMMILKLRNRTQGWSLSQPIMMASKKRPTTSQPVQLTLF